MLHLWRKGLLKAATEDANIKTAWKDKDNKEIKARMYCTTCKRQKEPICKVVIDKAIDAIVKLGKRMVLLDNQADVSIMHSSMLEDIQTSYHKLRIKGVRGVQFMVSEQGNLPEIFLSLCQ
jgi:hypothetical protein